eukprot:JP446704.1.p1 GENE.JP446704.1~~JP446704.1.p1  ORF type:complete len:267 (-),score=138.40 JP446704.1:74-874(-)
MAVGKNKRLSKGKKGKGKKAADPFAKKEWYEVRAPSMFTSRAVGKTMVSRTTGTKIASEALKNRIINVSLADLNNDEDQAHRTIRLRVDEVQGRNCLTNFHGMNFTSDKLRSLVRKWQTLIECSVDVKTLDGYYLRIFCISFTKKRQNQLKKTAYAQTAQIRMIRKKMTEIITNEASSVELKDLVLKFVPEIIGTEIQKACSAIYPLQNTYIRKCKVLKTPKFDVSKLLELHADTADDAGAKVDRAIAEDVALAAAVAGTADPEQK